MMTSFPEYNVGNSILIAGPTASGKSFLALHLALKYNSVIINTDSMQIYEALPVLTAQPDAGDLAIVPHFLYSCVPSHEVFSVSRWYDKVKDIMQTQELAGRSCIFVGGTGLYFRALLGGLSPVPPVDPDIRDKWRLFLQEEGLEALYRYLLQCDPVMASRLSPQDGQRMIRAIETLETTGHSLAEWQKQKGNALVAAHSLRKIVLFPERNDEICAINRRVDRMVKQGAIEEVQNLCQDSLDATLPIMKAIGVREFSAVLAGEIKLATAIEKIKIATRQYSKRQRCWFRHQLDAGWQPFSSARDAFDGKF